MNWPAVEPRSSELLSNGRPTAAIVLLHGYGADGSGMLPLGRQLASVIPGALPISLDGPEVVPGAGRRWFGILDIAEQDRGPRAETAAMALQPVLLDILERYGLDHRSLILVGFSQGATVALQFAATSAWKPRAVIAFSGRLAGRVRSDLSDKADVFITHGTDDHVIPASEAESAFRRLCDVGFAVKYNITPRVGHGISNEQIDAAAAFLAGIFPTPGIDIQEERSDGIRSL